MWGGLPARRAATCQGGRDLLDWVAETDSGEDDHVHVRRCAAGAALVLGNECGVPCPTVLDVIVQTVLAEVVWAQTNKRSVGRYQSNTPHLRNQLQVVGARSCPGPGRRCA